MLLLRSDCFIAGGLPGFLPLPSSRRCLRRRPPPRRWEMDEDRSWRGQQHYNPKNRVARRPLQESDWAGRIVSTIFLPLDLDRICAGYQSAVRWQSPRGFSSAYVNDMCSRGGKVKKISLIMVFAASVDLPIPYRIRPAGVDAYKVD